MPESNTQTVLKEMSKQLQQISDLLIQAYKHMPVIYDQKNVFGSQVTDDMPSSYVINYPFDTIEYDALLYVLPKYTAFSNDVRLCIIPNNNVSAMKEYTVYIEKANGALERAVAGSIVANRLATFRFNRMNKTSVILTNNPYSGAGAVAFASINVSQDAVFNEIPQVHYSKVLESNGQATEVVPVEDTVALQSQVDELADKVDILNKRIVVGTKEIDEAKDELKEGQIYIKVDEIIT